MAMKHISLWIDKDILNKCDAEMKIVKLRNRSSFLETAAEFYIPHFTENDAQPQPDAEGGGHPAGL